MYRSSIIFLMISKKNRCSYFQNTYCWLLPIVNCLSIWKLAMKAKVNSIVQQLLYPLNEHALYLLVIFLLLLFSFQIKSFSYLHIKHFNLFVQCLIQVSSVIESGVNIFQKIWNLLFSTGKGCNTSECVILFTSSWHIEFCDW